MTAENEKILLGVIEDTLWMAIRYAHGRNTYAPDMVRMAVKRLKVAYPDFKLGKDATIEAPALETIQGSVLRTDYLDDLFEDIYAKTKAD